MWHVAYGQVANAAHFRDAEEIEAAAEWIGEDGALADVLIDLGFVDAVEGGYVVHDIEDHCPQFVLKRIRRSRKVADNGGQRRTTADAGRQTADNGHMNRIGLDGIELNRIEKDGEGEDGARAQAPDFTPDPFGSTFDEFVDQVVDAYREHCRNLMEPPKGIKRSATGTNIVRLADDVGRDLGEWIEVFKLANQSQFLVEHRYGLDWLVKKIENWHATKNGRYVGHEKIKEAEEEERKKKSIRDYYAKKKAAEHDLG